MLQPRHHHWNLFVLYKELNVFDDDINCVCPPEEHRVRTNQNTCSINCNERLETGDINWESFL